MKTWGAANQQTRDVDPMLFYCWASVVDGGPALKQHWVNVSYLLGRQMLFFVVDGWPTLNQHWLSNSCLLNSHNNPAGLMIGQCRRCWPDIAPILDIGFFTNVRRWSHVVQRRRRWLYIKPVYAYYTSLCFHHTLKLIIYIFTEHVLIFSDTPL